MTSTNLSRLNACMTCGSHAVEIIDVDGAYSVTHFCDNYDTFVVSEQAETPEALVKRWNLQNTYHTDKLR